MAQTVEKVYADALFELSVEDNALDATFEELKALKAVFDENIELLRLLSSPVISEEEKHSIVKNVFEGRVSDNVYNFLFVLSDKGRSMYFDKIFEVFRGLYNDKNGILEVSVTTSEPLSQELEKKLIEKLEQSTGKRIVCEKNIDKSILGGMVIRYHNTEIDGSVKRRLDDMRKSIDSIIA